MKRTPKQIAEAEGVSQSTIYNLIRQHRLTAYRVGSRGKGKYLISDEDWQAFIESCRTSAVEPEDDSELTFFKR